ncbi:MAG TPA: hypothetical protein VK668_20480 [Mucilaginibacter sp.]|nr:hypothetical protein [Mucilaginibacter sp.]
MKKIYTLALLCLFVSQLRAQQGVIFKIKYMPQKTYQSSVGVGAKLNINLSGDPKFIDMLKSQGITPPVIASLNMGLGGTMKTGSLNADNTFPLAIDYKISNLAVEANGKQVPIPANVTEKSIKVMAHVNADGKIKIDSAEGRKVNDTTERKMQQMMDMMQKQIKFPDKPMKPGDSFTQDTPMNIPVGKENNVKIEGGLTYKLISIADGKAYFDMIPSFSMNLTIKNTTITMTGMGTGKMVYSIKDNFPLSKDVKFTMKIKVVSPKVNVDGTADVTSTYSATIN